jgi:NADH-quinone oxidoreductase subunit I
MGLFKDIKNLLVGMKITSKHLGKHAITIQYPEQKWEMPERSRGIVVLLSDKETGELNCTSCLLCMKACPTGAIFIDAPRDEVTKKRNMKSFTVDHGLCCFCGLCEEACNFSALKMAGKYEFSTIHKADLIWDVKKLQEMGRDVPYIDNRKKKAPAAEAKPATPATPAKPTAEAAAPAATEEKSGEGSNA